ncbi:hypothetical protein ACHAXS_007172 [Conticribra weissflogii]
MRSSTFFLTLSSCLAAGIHGRPSFHHAVSGPRTSSSSSWIQIPRGGADESSNNNSNNNNNSNGASSMKSLLDAMSAGNSGLPDLSAPPSPEQLQQSMAQFQALLASPQFQAILNDPSKLEEQLENARQNVLKLLHDLENGEGELGGNPMMKMMMEQMKGQVAEVYPGGWDGLKGRLVL